MSARDFSVRAREALGGPGWRTRLAEITGKNYATVKRWASGELEVPVYAVAIVQLIEQLPDAARATLLERPKRKRAPRRRRQLSAA